MTNKGKIVSKLVKAFLNNLVPKTTDEYKEVYEKWSTLSAYPPIEENDHYVIKGICGCTLGQCRCGGDKVVMQAPIPCPKCWSKQTKQPEPKW